MQVNCLSIKNPLSYMVASGIKTVENRTWKTDYRGWLYIHSSGATDQFFFSDDDLKPYQVAFPSADDSPRETWTREERREFELAELALKYYRLSDFADISADRSAMERAGRPFFVTHSIIGRAHLDDIVRDSDSPFAEPGQYHWILSGAELWRDPLRYVAGKLRIWTFDLPSEYTDPILL